MGKMPFLLHGEVATFSKLSFGKMYIYEVVVWEIAHLGSCHLENYHLKSCPHGKMPLGKYLTPYTVHIQFKTLFGLGMFKLIFCGYFFKYAWFGKHYPNIKYVSFNKLPEL